MLDFGVIKELRQEWPSVRAAKWAITLAGLLCFGAGFTIARLLDSDTEATLRERISYWQDRAQGGESVHPRHLTSDQEAKLLEAIKPIASSIQGIVVTSETLSESVRFANDFLKVLKEAGANPVGPIFGFSESETDRGIMIGIANLKQPSDLALRFTHAVQSAGLEVKTAHWASQSGAHDFDLFIGSP